MSLYEKHQGSDLERELLWPQIAVGLLVAFEKGKQTQEAPRCSLTGGLA